MENEVRVFQIKLLHLCPIPEGGGYALSVCVYVSPSLYLELPGVVSGEEMWKEKHRIHSSQYIFI